MKIEKHQSANAKRAVSEYCILSILKDGRPIPVTSPETLKDAKMLVVEGTVYPLLTRLKKCGAAQLLLDSPTVAHSCNIRPTETGKLFLKELNTT
ncbi:MAG: PadR family transcriptional regulator [Flavobacteriaceae bacterium]